MGMSLKVRLGTFRRLLKTYPFNPLDAMLPLDVRVLVSRHYFLMSSALSGPEHSLNAPMPDWPVNAARCILDAPDNQLKTSQALC